MAGELAALGCERVTLSGGEPLLRRDWPVIAHALVDAGVRVGMISNGLAFGPREARQAAEAGLSSVSFSVDGLEATHDCLRNRPGGFRRVQAAFGAAVEAGLPACAVTHVHRDNLDELDEMHQQLGGLGVRSWKLQLCNPAGEASAHRELILEPRDLLQLVPKMVELKGRGRPLVEASDSIGYFGPYEQALRGSWRDELSFWTGCYAGCRAIGIESHGNVKGCLALPSERHGVHDFIEGNVRSSALADIWLRPGAFAYNRAFHPRQLTGFCRTCPYGEICRAGCHWTALAQGGTLRENRFCYYRVSVEAQRARRGPRRWFVRSLAPAALVATLGVAGCWQSYQEWADGGDAATDTLWPEGARTDVLPSDADAAPSDAADVPAMHYGPVPVDADAETGDGFPIMYGPARPDADGGTDDGQRVYYGPAPVNAGTDSVNVPASWYGPVINVGPSADATGDASTCPDPCGPAMFYGPSIVFPPGCRYTCDGTETCPTAVEACCMCDYDGPEPVPPECEDPCAGGK